MRIALLFGCLMMGVAALQAAEPFVAPDFVKNFEEMEEAKEAAARNNKGLTFLLMEPGST